MKIEKISKLAFYACIGAIIVCFTLFLTVGYNNPVGDYNAPKLTDVIMWLMYVLATITALLTVWSVIRGIQSSKGLDSTATTGVPGSKITMATVLLLVASLVGGVIFGLGEPDFTAADGTVTVGYMVTIVDMFCISIGVMFVVAAIAVAISMSGILTKNVSK